MKRSLPIITALFLLIQGGSYAQELIKGIVKDESGSSLPGATVVIKGTNKYALSDASGSFALAAGRELPVTLHISSVGYKTQDIEVYELPDEPLEVLL